MSEEGVEEGSAAGTVEGPDTGADDVAGAGGQGAPLEPAQAAAPQALETEESREAAGPGQQYQVGEG